MREKKIILRRWSKGSSSGSCPEDDVRIVRAHPKVFVWWTFTLTTSQWSYTRITLQLPLTLTISSATQVRGSDSIGYEVCGLAAKDHYNQNDGEEKSAPLR